MTRSQEWITRIEEACCQSDMVLSNQMITEVHHDLSEALARQLGRAGGPNFHSWAVWGSRKAGVTIRQEDLDSAINNAKSTAGIVGLVVGGAVGFFVSRMLGIPSLLGAAAGAAIGAPSGAATGRHMAVWSRRKAAELILEGNRTVLRDIGSQSARFLELLEKGASAKDRDTFFHGLRSGPMPANGQNLLTRAFHAYLSAFDSQDIQAKSDAMIRGNCQIVLHEHIRLQPFISGAMPFIVRRCATQRLMSYEVGDKRFSIAEDVPGSPAGTAARDWTNIQERMTYIFALFTKFHHAPEVFAAP